MNTMIHGSVQRVVQYTSIVDDTGVIYEKYTVTSLPGWWWVALSKGQHAQKVWDAMKSRGAGKLDVVASLVDRYSVDRGEAL